MQDLKHVFSMHQRRLSPPVLYLGGCPDIGELDAPLDCTAMTTLRIDVEATPNPDALRILTGSVVWSGTSIELSCHDDASGAPLAEALFQVEGVEVVLLGHDFATVVRSSGKHDWDRLKPALLEKVTEFLWSGKPAVIRAEKAAPTDAADADLVTSHIREVLERYVRPFLARDGGEATLAEFDHESGIVRVKMGGACGGCPSGKTTLKRGIEQTIKRYVPEVRGVEAVDERRIISDPKARFRAWIADRWPGL